MATGANLDQGRKPSRVVGQTEVRAVEPHVSAWAVGFTLFASSVLLLIGGFHALTGLVALFQNQFFVLGQDYLFKFDISTWGWVQLIVGIAVFAAGLGLLSGATWARVVGVTLAVISALVNFTFLPWYPFWSALIIGLDVAAIWALTAHGRDITAT
jgi:hypothetical protein